MHFYYPLRVTTRMTKLSSHVVAPIVSLRPYSSYTISNMIRNHVGPTVTTVTALEQQQQQCLRNEQKQNKLLHQHQQSRRTIHIEKKLEELNITLPTPPSPKANYNIVCYTTGNMMYISGHLPIMNDGTLITGRIGSTESGGETVVHGYTAARYAGLNIIATLKEQLGDLDRVQQIVKVFGIVQSTDDFKEQHKVMDGCSDVIMEVFGNPIGYHARSAIGTSTLPLNMSVEIEAIVQIKP